MNKNLQSILYGLITAMLFSAFIYLKKYDINLTLVNTFLALSAFTLFLKIPKKAILFSGFFIGLFWFYWIGYSFKYQGVGYMTPFITIGFGFIYMLFFAPLALTNNPFLRAIFLFILSYFEPFDWNWLVMELPFVESYFGVEKYQFAIILTSLALFVYLPRKRAYLALLLLLLSINFHTKKPQFAPLNIKLVQTEIAQEDKWKRENQASTIAMIYDDINKAIEKRYDLIVLPESVFPFYMNQHPEVIQKLQHYSYKIAIVCGSLLYENNAMYNVTYKFENGEYKIAKKVVLVPFGEYIPLPKFAQKFINDTFFSGGSDFIAASQPTDFIIKGVKFRNAICYEATCEELYKGDPKYMLATSNNAWFAPSIEPTIQKLLMEFYAKKHHTVIYHSANVAGSGVVW
jgi:apolipoprotein N-acyltransferase